MSALALLWMTGSILCGAILMYLLTLGLEMLTARRRNLGMLIDTLLTASEHNTPLAEIFRVVADDASGVTDIVFRNRLQSVLILAEEGFPLGEALRRQKGYFPENVCNMLGAGERYGNLRLFASHLRDMFAEGMSLRETVLRSLIYPTFLWWGIAFILFLIAAAITPQFKAMFVELRPELPAATRFLIGNMFWMLWVMPALLCLTTIVILFGGTFGTMTRRRSRFLASLADGVLAVTPWFGRLVRWASYAQFAHSVGALLDCGMPLHEAVEASLQMDLNRGVKKRLEKTHRLLVEGASFGEALRASGAPEELCWFVETGERSGVLGDHLLRLSELYGTRFRIAMKTSPKLVVPFVTIPAGIMVGFTVYALWAPLISIVNQMI